MTNIPASNDISKLIPHTEIREPILNFNFPGIKIGVAQYKDKDGVTGCTVFYFDKTDSKLNIGANFYADVRGGAPGVRFQEIGWAHAICFAGGSLLGIEACDGVTAELFKQNNYSVNWMDIPIVPGAIIFDFGARNNSVYPDKELGRAAFCAAQEGKFPLGRQGAGSSASVGKCLDFKVAKKEFSGQGAAFKQIGDVKILACCVVNAMGVIRDRTGKILRGHLNEKNEHTEFLDNLKERSGGKNNNRGKTISENTTLTIIITNQKFDHRSLEQTAKQIHSSMSRAIDPFHTLEDGDVLFMVTTNELSGNHLSPVEFGVIASEVVWDAVLCCYEDN
jgi:L-aminopeptidase/D-esterase-like protein